MLEVDLLSAQAAKGASSKSVRRSGKVDEEPSHAEEAAEILAMQKAGFISKGSLQGIEPTADDKVHHLPKTSPVPTNRPGDKRIRR